MPRRERPLEAGDGVLLRFAADLRALRNKAGDPTYRELARRAHYSAGTLSDAAGGRKLPTLAATLAYVRACDGEPEEWARRWHEVAAELAVEEAGPDEDPPDENESPYVGLRFFRTEDTSRFFGRDQLTADLAARLARQRFLAVFGPSGAGKSSLLRAGLVPGLCGDSVLFTPGPRPMEECAIQLARLLGTTAGRLYPELVADRRNLHRAVRQALADRPDTELVLVVDQFEEVFTLCQDTTERTAFITSLLTAATAENSRTRIVLGVRADFYPHCADHPDLAAALSDAQVLVGPMTTSELRDAIVQPAVQAGYAVEGTLVTELIAQAQGQAGVLPLLSHALSETWRRRRGNTLTLTGYHAAGSIQGALARTAEHHYSAFTTDEQQHAKQLFLRLTALGDGTDDTKRRVSHAELDTSGLDTVLPTLAAARLITVDDRGVEIAHESLIKAWPRLRGWLAEDRDGLRVHRQLTDATTTWESLQRDPGALYRGTRLTVAADWADHHDPALTAREREFLDTSRAVNRRERVTTLRRNRQLRWLAAGLALALVATGVMAVSATRQQAATAEQREIALSRQFAAQASAVATQDTSKAIRWSLEAFHHYPTVEARSALLSVAGRPADHGSFRLARTSSAIGRSVLSADGQLLAVPEEHRVYLYDVPTRREIAVLRQPAGTDSRSFYTVAFSPDRTRLATGSVDGHIELWDVTRRTQIAEFPGQGTRTLAVAFNPDGMRVAAIDSHQAMRMWETSGRLLLSVPGNEYEQDEGLARASAAFSPDGRTLATTSGRAQVVLWNLATLTPRFSLPTSDVGNRHLGFSPDGRRLAIPGRKGDLEVWDVATQTLVENYPLTSAANDIDFDRESGGLIFSTFDDGMKLQRSGEIVVSIPGTENVGSFQLADNGTLISATAQGLRIWKLNKIPALDYPPPTGIAFDFDERKILGVKSGFPLKIWHVDDFATYSTPFPGEEVAYSIGGKISPDRSRSVLTVGRRTIVLYDLNKHSRVTELTAPEGELSGLAFSPDSRLLAASYLPENTMRIESGYTLVWDLRTHQPVARLPVPAMSLAFSPDSRRLALCATTTVSIWDIPTRTKVHELPTTRTRVFDIKYSPDAQLLAIGAIDGTVGLWNATHHDHIADLRGHTGAVHNLAFNPDSTLLATAGADTDVILWDLATRTPWATLTGHTGAIDTMTWNADGTTLATASSDGTITLWPVSTEQAIQHLCRTLTSDFPQDAQPRPLSCNQPAGRR